MSTGNQVGAAAQGASAAPSIEALLSQLGDTHRRVLTQAQVLGKVAGDWLASAENIHFSSLFVKFPKNSSLIFAINHSLYLRCKKHPRHIWSVSLKIPIIARFMPTESPSP